ncbi:MFS general substrate transporter [Aureobasidium pullulans]|uniref:Lysosomal dipeptide transporter MFSD1 n=1 Tax=Aureobasidium pullulans TaxID=5580 RepID=A0A4S9PHF1_AURPU|nr:MFS general substrate transporter [Aureobasidium pullulans]THZ35946.1 MFS general substrate transporter [Aureobasidium pullulans]THZ55182.1 MFS general substrate transporter [Aureobasidium pullulans]THZ68515.1 MFS general substrate transporter [Aureobasidium pullulans]
MIATKAQDSTKVHTTENTVQVGSFGFDDPQADAENNPDHDPADETIPWKLKWIALLCFVSFPIGQTWTQSSLGPLKNTLRNELGISNTQFGVVSSADAIVNSVWPIIGGVLLDWFGPNIIVLLCTGIIFIGSILAASATNLGVWRVLTGGHILMGFGIAVLDTAQQKFFFHWFGISGLAFAFGFENAINKTVSLVAGMTAIPIRNSTGWYGWSFWIPAVFCGMSTLFAIAYILFEKYIVPERFRLKSGRQTSISSDDLAQKRKVVSFGTILRLPWAFWMLPMTQLLQSGAAGGFSVSAADIIRMKGYTEAVAGYLSTAQDILPIVLSPILGIAIDRYGHRFHWVALAPVFWIMACSLIGFTSVHPLAALVFSSLAGVINSMPLQICIPLLVMDQNKLGTAFGLWRAFNNSGSTIMDIAFGVLQDGTEGQGYNRVLLLAIGIKGWAFCLGVSYILVDYFKLGKGMTMTRKQRQKREAIIEDAANDPLTRRTIVPKVTYAGLGLLTSIVMTAWVVFIKYLL